MAESKESEKWRQQVRRRASKEKSKKEEEREDTCRKGLFSVRLEVHGDVAHAHLSLLVPLPSFPREDNLVPYSVICRLLPLVLEFMIPFC